MKDLSDFEPDLSEAVFEDGFERCSLLEPCILLILGCGVQNSDSEFQGLETLQIYHSVDFESFVPSHLQGGT